jgi:hypothetical protein
MGKRLVSLLTALALAVSAFASLTVAPAGAQVGPEFPDTTIYFPFVPNGEVLAGTGPWFGAIAIQNVEGTAIVVEVYRAGTSAPVSRAQVNANGSRVWTSGDIFGSASSGTFFPVRGTPANTADVISLGSCQPTSISVRQGDTRYSSPSDYTYTISGSTLTINWAPAGAEPAGGTSYTVTATGPGCGGQGGGVFVRGCVDDDNDGVCEPDEELAPIAGVVKTAAPRPLTSDGRTTAQHEMVSGYTALPNEALDDDQLWGLPIVQSGWSGWNSVIYITNFSDEDNCAVDVTLYESPFGLGDSAPGIFSETLDSGDTWVLDLTGWQDNWAGSAFIDADCAIAVSSDRIKAEQPWGDPVNMALSNVGQPFNEAEEEVFAPLIFDRYNGWNTGISIVNLNDVVDANVTITFYNLAGAPAGSATLRLRPRAVEWIYRPNLTNLGLMSVAQARIVADVPIAVAVDQVKYVGADADTGHAMSYNAQTGGEDLALPLFQNAGTSNDISGIAIYNPNNSNADVTVEVYSRTGFLWATFDYTISANGAAIIYAPTDLPELPGGFVGNVYISSDEEVVAVSNNVAYADVPAANRGPQFDGSAAFNMAVLD